MEQKKIHKIYFSSANAQTFSNSMRTRTFENVMIKLFPLRPIQLTSQPFIHSFIQFSRRRREMLEPVFFFFFSFSDRERSPIQPAFIGLHAFIRVFEYRLMITADVEASASGKEMQVKS